MTRVAIKIQMASIVSYLLSFSRLWIVRRGEHRPLPGSPCGVSAVSYSAILILRQIPTAVRVDSS